MFIFAHNRTTLGIGCHYYWFENKLLNYNNICMQSDKILSVDLLAYKYIDPHTLHKK